MSWMCIENRREMLRVGGSIAVNRNVPKSRSLLHQFIVKIVVKLYIHDTLGPGNSLLLLCA